MEEENFLSYNSRNKSTKNPKSQYKSPIITNQNYPNQYRPVLPVFNYNPSMNQYRYPTFPPQYRQPIPYFRPLLPSFNFPKQTSYQNFRPTQNLQSYNNANRPLPIRETRIPVLKTTKEIIIRQETQWIQARLNFEVQWYTRHKKHLEQKQTSIKKLKNENQPFFKQQYKRCLFL